MKINRHSLCLALVVFSSLYITTFAAGLHTKLSEFALKLETITQTVGQPENDDQLSDAFTQTLNSINTDQFDDAFTQLKNQYQTMNEKAAQAELTQHILDKAEATGLQECVATLKAQEILRSAGGLENDYELSNNGKNFLEWIHKQVGITTIKDSNGNTLLHLIGRKDQGAKASPIISWLISQRAQPLTANKDNTKAVETSGAVAFYGIIEAVKNGGFHQAQRIHETFAKTYATETGAGKARIGLPEKQLISANYAMEYEARRENLLHYAAYAENIPLINFLVNTGDYPLEDGSITPLGIAIAYGKVNSVRTLLAHGASVRIVSSSLQGDQQDAVTLLTQAQQKRTPLQTNAKIEPLLQASLCPNTEDDPAATCPQKLTSPLNLSLQERAAVMINWYYNQNENNVNYDTLLEKTKEAINMTSMSMRPDEKTALVSLAALLQDPANHQMPDAARVKAKQVFLNESLSQEEQNTLNNPGEQSQKLIEGFKKLAQEIKKMERNSPIAHICKERAKKHASNESEGEAMRTLFS